jgi:hypothetical protein
VELDRFRTLWHLARGEIVAAVPRAGVRPVAGYLPTPVTNGLESTTTQSEILGSLAIWGGEQCGKLDYWESQRRLS